MCVCVLIHYFLRSMYNVRLFVCVRARACACMRVRVDLLFVAEYRPLQSLPTPRLLFQIPPGTYCPHRRNTKELPTLRNAFSFSSEIVMPESKSITFLKVSTFKIVMPQLKSITFLKVSTCKIEVHNIS